jgi:cytochrome c
MTYRYLIYFFMICSILTSCETAEEEPVLIQKDYIKEITGKSEIIPPEKIQKGEVLIAYSDCNSCHKNEERSKGPAFTDIAKRYPVQPAYIELLALRIIKGGSRSWGYSVMNPHPDLSVDDAKLMVYYILSLK